MNKYRIDQTSRTLNTVVIAGMLASTCLPSDCNSAPPSCTLYSSASNNYAFTSLGTSLTNESNKNILAGHHGSSIETPYEAMVTSFFEELSANQEPLGNEFERVLFENLWDLYQS